MQTESVCFTLNLIIFLFGDLYGLKLLNPSYNLDDVESCQISIFILKMDKMTMYKKEANTFKISTL